MIGTKILCLGGRAKHKDYVPKPALQYSGMFYAKAGIRVNLSSVRPPRTRGCEEKEGQELLATDGTRISTEIIRENPC